MAILLKLKQVRRALHLNMGQGNVPLCRFCSARLTDLRVIDLSEMREIIVWVRNVNRCPSEVENEEGKRGPDF